MWVQPLFQLDDVIQYQGFFIFFKKIVGFQSVVKILKILGGLIKFAQEIFFQNFETFCHQVSKIHHRKTNPCPEPTVPSSIGHTL